ncbi:MAG: helical backbone metal receptor [Burkholderiales bacterium]
MIIRWLCAALLAGLAGGASGAISVTDDDGHVFVLDQPARRIVTLSPSLAEIVFAVGAGDRLVGVSSYSDDPTEASKIRVVASSGRIDIEHLRWLRPDLVIAWRTGNPARDLERIKRMRMPVFMTEPRSLMDIARVVRSIGALTGNTNAAEATARSFEALLASLSITAAEPLPAFVEIWHKPLLTVNGEHLMTDILRVCGASNVFAGIPALTARVSPEQLLIANPRLLIVSGTAEARQSIIERWQAFKLVRAVQDGRIVVIDPRILHRQGLRIVEAVGDVCAAVRQARST